MSYLSLSSRQSLVTSSRSIKTNKIRTSYPKTDSKIDFYPSGRQTTWFTACARIPWRVSLDGTRTYNWVGVSGREPEKKTLRVIWYSYGSLWESRFIKCFLCGVLVNRYRDKGIPVQIDSLVCIVVMKLEQDNLILPREFLLAYLRGGFVVLVLWYISMWAFLMLLVSVNIYSAKRY